MTNEKLNPSNCPGLVNSDISVRDELYEPLLVSEKQIKDSAQKIFNESTKPENSDLRNFKVSISPASIKVSSSSKIKSGTKPRNYEPKKEIKNWSSKSRSGMIARFATLNFEPLVSLNNPPIMLTLTYPKNWEKLVPTAQEAKRHLRAFKKRYERKFSVPLAGLWKMEFQRRSAVHWHILCNPPVSVREFKEWVSITWADVVGEPNPKEREKHIQAGTGIDMALGFTATDTKRISIYFSKHSSPNLSPKEYQNKPPQLWLDNGNSVGRYWGYWHLTPSVAEADVSREVAVFIARTLRRWHRSKTPFRKNLVWRVRQETGVLSRRKVNRRIKRFNNSSGYLVVDDGSYVGEIISRAIKARFN